MRLFGCICIVLAAASCFFSSPSEQATDSACRANVITVFISGNELGRIKPCGCSEEQLGGLEKRAAVLNSAPASRRLVIDTGRLVVKDDEQAQLKFQTIIEAFSLLDYDVVSLTPRDIDMAERLGLLEEAPTGFSFISAYDVNEVNISKSYSKHFQIGDEKIVITVASFDPESTDLKRIAELFPSNPGTCSVNILVSSYCDGALSDSIARTGVVDVLICPPESDKPQVLSKPGRRPVVVSEPRYGEYLGKLQLQFSDGGKKPKISFSAVEIREGLPSDESLVELYKSYQQLVKEAGLLEKHPRFQLPGGLKYVGSESCKLCHSYEYEKWSGLAHARAFQTLRRVGSEYDPECVLCHTVGFDYESGFVSPEKTPQLENVGCENCHGPGSAHIESLGSEPPGQPRTKCLDCHTPYHSYKYAGNEKQYFQKIIHWREPNAPGDVKNK